MDLSTLSVAQLRDLQQQIPGELKRREKQEKSNLIKDVRDFVRARGFTMEDLRGEEGATKATAGTKVRIKYRHPQDGSLTWTGRGRKPKWVEAWLANGGNLDNLLV